METQTATAPGKKIKGNQEQAPERIFMERNDPELKKEHDRYLKLLQVLKALQAEFKELGLGTFSSLDEILAAIREEKFLDNYQVKMIDQQESIDSLCRITLFKMRSVVAYNSLVKIARELSQGLSLEWFAFTDGEVILNEVDLSKFLADKWSFYLTDPKDIATYHRRKAFAEACNIMFREEGLSLTNLHFFIENTSGQGSDYKPKFSFTPPWNTAGW